MGVIAIVALAGTIAALAPSNQKELEAAYRKLDTAMRNHDLIAYMAQLSPDFQEERLARPVKSRAEAEAGYRQLMQDWTRLWDQKLSILHLKVNGKKATAIVERMASGDFLDRLGAYGPKSRSHVLTSDIVEIDTWNRTAAGWLLRTRQISVAKLLVDGRPWLGVPAHDD